MAHKHSIAARRIMSEKRKAYWALHGARPMHSRPLEERRAVWREVYDARTDRRLQKHFGITQEQYNVMFAAQNGKCAICDRPESISNRKDGQPARLSVDHDHVTGKVRGLLCHRCNRGIGHFQDEPELLKSAISYLKGSV